MSKKKKIGHKKRTKKRLKKKQRFSLLSDFFLALLIAGVIMSLCLSFFFKINRIQGYGMIPTLRDQDVVLVKKTNRFKRFDIVLIRRGTKYTVRRLIGLPQEKIEYANDSLYVNDNEVDEKFIIDEINERQLNGDIFTEDFTLESKLGVTRIPSNCYLVLGDDRPNATDSRYYGLVRQDQLVGVVKFRFLPLEHSEIF